MKEFLVNEEDTVTVGQDLLVLEIAGEGTAAEKGSQAPKAPAAEDQPTSSYPEPKKDNDHGQSEKEPSSPPASQSQMDPSAAEVDKPEQSTEATKGVPRPHSESSQVDLPSGDRQERRVFHVLITFR
jgi:2-oxoglutarate dehydrogenase E2 component (dihydrolipoamide succinyltransferase)